MQEQRIYRSIDKIQHLCVRVKIRKRHSNFSVEKQQDKWKDELVVKWMEKIEGKRILFTKIDMDEHMDMQFGFGMERQLESLFPVSKYDIFAIDSQLDNVVGLPVEKDRWKRDNQRGLFSKMEVCANLSSEHLLLTVRTNGHGLVIVQPDFNTLDQLYTFKDGNDVFEYLIENVSQTLSQEDEDKERMIFSEYYRRQAQLKYETLALKGLRPIPEPFKKRIAVTGEIAFARQFQCNSLYIHYDIHLPSHSRTDPEYPNSVLHGNTQIGSCVPMMHSHLREHRLGLPFELNIVTNAEIFDMPTIYLKVVSVDVWDRHCVIGYCYLKLEHEPGSYQKELPTWKPMLSVESRLKSYFIGGGPELDNYEDVVLVQPGQVANRYGFQTETSGSVVLRYNIVRQTNVQDTLVGQMRNDPKGLVLKMTEILHRAKQRLDMLKK
ncbi:ciliary basal body-associated, B9 protein-domain-containing protein, partial [Gorgonomyces haynaldii]